MPDKPKPTPEALYPCRYQHCAEYVSHPAEDLFWSETVCGWVCGECWEAQELPDEPELKLSDEIARRDIGLSAFKHALVKHRLVNPDAFEDPDGYDAFATEENALCAYEDLFPAPTTDIRESRTTAESSMGVEVRDSCRDDTSWDALWDAQNEARAEQKEAQRLDDEKEVEDE